MKNIQICVFEKSVDIRLDTTRNINIRCTNSLQDVVNHNLKNYIQEFTDNMWHSIKGGMIMKNRLRKK